MAWRGIALCLAIFLAPAHGVPAQQQAAGTAVAAASTSVAPAQVADGGKDAAVLEKIGGITTSIGRMNGSVSERTNGQSTLDAKLNSFKWWLLTVLIVAVLTLLVQVVAYLIPRRNDDAASRNAVESHSTTLNRLVTDVKTMAADTQGRTVALEKTVEDVNACVLRIKDLVSSPPRSVVPHVSDGQVLLELRSTLDRVQPTLATEVGRVVSEELVRKAEGQTKIEDELKRVRAELGSVDFQRARAEQQREVAIRQAELAHQEKQKLLNEKAALEDRLQRAENRLQDHQARLEHDELQRETLRRDAESAAKLKEENAELRRVQHDLTARLNDAESRVRQSTIVGDGDLAIALRGVAEGWYEDSAYRGVYHSCCALFQAAERRHHEMAREWIAGVDRAIVAAGGGDDRRIEGLRAALVDVINQRIQGCYRIEWPKVGTEFLPKRHVPEGPRGLSIAKVLSAVILSPSGDVVALARVQTV